jgi:nucleotide-binding universal stress UspA family protein
MSYKTILVCLESESQATPLLKAAVRLADQHESHLIGTYIAHPIEMQMVRAAEAVGSTDILKVRIKDEVEQASRLEELFENATRVQNFVAEWRFQKQIISTVSAAIMEQARSADVLLLSADFKNSDSSFAYKNISPIITHCSRPTIVVPKDYQAKSLGKYVFVAWDASSESSRAISDALPILIRAESVWLHRVKSNDEDKQHGDEITRNLADSLARHGVSLETSNSTSSARDVGQEILACARDRGADCIVMGAYGHSRIHSFLLGGATRYVLENSSVPLIMSH